MSDEITRYVPTDQDMRSSAIYIAERLVTAKMANSPLTSPAQLTVEYADTIFKYIKEGRTNG